MEHGSPESQECIYKSLNEETEENREHVDPTVVVVYLQPKQNAGSGLLSPRKYIAQLITVVVRLSTTILHSSSPIAESPPPQLAPALANLFSPISLVSVPKARLDVQGWQA